MSIVYSNALAIIGFCPGDVFFTFNRCEIVEILLEQRKTPININWPSILLQKCVQVHCLTTPVIYSMTEPRRKKCFGEVILQKCFLTFTFHLIKCIWQNKVQWLGLIACEFGRGVSVEWETFSEEWQRNHERRFVLIFCFIFYANRAKNCCFAPVKWQR